MRDCQIPKKDNSKIYLHYFYIRLVVDDMSIDIYDFKFATASVANEFDGFATAGDCYSKYCGEDWKRGNFQVDISGTNFLLPDEIPYSFIAYPDCAQQVYKPTMSPDRRQCSGFCGGHCGRCWPTKFYVLLEGCQNTRPLCFQKMHYSYTLPVTVSRLKGK